MPKAFKKAVDARLRIKHLTDPSNKLEAQFDPKVMAFFVNPALFELPKQKNARQTSLSIGNARSGYKEPERETDESVDQLFSDIGVFDIRKGICSNLLNPDPQLNQIGTSSAQRSLLGQYEKSEMLFDVYQDLHPFDVNLRVNAFEKEHFKLLSSAAIAGPELKNFLM